MLLLLGVILGIKIAGAEVFMGMAQKKMYPEGVGLVYGIEGEIVYFKIPVLTRPLREPMLKRNPALHPPL